MLQRTSTGPVSLSISAGCASEFPAVLSQGAVEGGLCSCEHGWKLLGAQEAVLLPKGRLCTALGRMDYRVLPQQKTGLCCLL